MTPRIASWFTLTLALLATPIRARGSDPTIHLNDLRADFQELYVRLQESHFDLYARRKKAEYDRLYARMLGSFTRPLPRSQALLAYQRFLAFGRVAHARMDEPDGAFEAFRAGGGRAFPLMIRIHQGRAYVAYVAYVGSNFSGDTRIAAGDEILAVEGRPMGRILQAFSQYVSADSDYLLHTLAEQDFGRLLWHLLGPHASFRVVLRRAKGNVYECRVSARTRTEMRAEAQSLPPGLDLDWTTREAKVLPGGVAYLRPGPFFNAAEGATDPWDTTAFVQFVDQAFAGFIQSGAQNLLIDLRDNPGGDNSFSDVVVAWFATQPFSFASQFLVKVSPATTASNAARLPNSPPGSISHRFATAFAAHATGVTFPFDLPTTPPRTGARYTGRVFLLVNRHSYSNTASMAALVQDYHFAQILGEETADLATTYGAMEHFNLTRTGFKVGYPKALIVRPNGDRSAHGVVPDHPIATPLAPSAVDPVLKEALAWIGGRAAH